MITLKSAAFNANDPFKNEYAKLLTLWPEPYKSEFEHATRNDVLTGQILYAFDEDKLVGITGVFLDSEKTDDLFMRWTGILPEHRRNGYAHSLVLALVGHCERNYLNHTRLIELVPDNEYGHTQVEPFFKAIGFKKGRAKIPASEIGSYGHLVYYHKLGN
jgi:GNAT superfamily N-acetyltransferase